MFIYYTQTMSLRKVKRILITGVTGQDGSYLADLFLSLGYEVHGLVRRSSSFNTARIDYLLDGSIKNDSRLFLHYGDMSDPQSLNNLVTQLRPYAVFNLAAQSHVRISFDLPNYTFSVNTSGVLNLLEAIRIYSPESKFYQASTSELFGNSAAPQGDKTLFAPESPYAVSKLSAHELVRLWSEAYGIYATSGILFNHESFRRGENFLTKKVVKNAVRIRKSLDQKQQKIEKLKLGNLDAIRDWGWAPEYVVAMSRLIELEKPRPICIGTGVSASVREFLAHTFDYFDLDVEEWVEHADMYERPTEVHELRADTRDMREILRLSPQHNWKSLNRLMCEQELQGFENKLDWDSISNEMERL
jgi:GDPmannose 4,6-dehydratase